MINLELPDLPYSKDALAPYMSAETLELHHDKHHMAYVTNGNKFIKENNFNEDSIKDIVKNSFKKNAPVFNNVSQHLNHMHFWEIMQNNPNGKIPTELENKINEDFGSIDNMKENFINAGIGFVIMLFLHYYNRLNLIKVNGIISNFSCFTTLV